MMIEMSLARSASLENKLPKGGQFYWQDSYCISRK